MAGPMESKERYKKWFHISLTTNFILAIVVGLQFTALGIYLFMEKPPRIVGLTSDFRAVQMTSLKRPIMADPGVLQFAADAVPRVLSLDFDKWRRTMADARKYFSPRAYRSYQNEIEGKEWIGLIKTKNLLVSTIVSGPPIIIRRYLKSGALTYQVQIPIQVSVQSSANVMSRNEWTINLEVQRCPLTVQERGVWISLFQII